MSGRRVEAEGVLREIEHPPSPRYVDPYAVAVAYTALGESNQAFAWLERAFEEDAVWLTLFVKCDPRFDRLRSDPRFQDLFRRMGLGR